MDLLADLRVPLPPLGASAAAPELVFDVVMRHVGTVGGEPARRILVSVLGSLTKENTDLLRENVQLAQLLAERCERVQVVSSRPSSAASSSCASSVAASAPRPPCLSPAVAAGMSRRTHVILVEACPQAQAQAASQSSPSSSSSTFGAAATSIIAQAVAAAGPGTTAAEVLLAAGPTSPVVSALRGLLSKEQQALLSDAEELRQAILRPAPATPSCISTASQRTTPTLSNRVTPLGASPAAPSAAAAELSAGRVRSVLLARLSRHAAVEGEDAAAQKPGDDDDLDLRDV